MVDQLLNRALRIAMMNEEAARLLHKVTVLLAIMHQRNARAMFRLQGSARREHLDTEKVPLCPTALLWFGAVAAAGQSG